MRVGKSLVTAMTKSGVRLGMLDATNAANDAVVAHKIPSAVHARVLAEAMNAAVLLNIDMTGEERVQLQLLAQQEESRVQHVHVETISTGELRGFINPIGPPLGTDIDEGLAENSVLGQNPIMHVAKVLYNEAEKQQSYISIPDPGTVEAGLQYFFEQSDQIETFVRLVSDVKVTSPLPHFGFAGAVFAQRMPGVSDDDWHGVVDYLTQCEPNDGIQFVPELEQGPAVLRSAGKDGKFAGDLQRAMTDGLPSLDFDTSTFQRKPIDFFCRCNRDNFLGGLRSLNEAVQRDLFGEANEPLVITCQHCSKDYSFEPEDLQPATSTPLSTD